MNYFGSITCYKNFRVKVDKPMKLNCDDKATINIAHNPVQHDRTKNAEGDRHFIKERRDCKLICTPFVKTHDQLVDILTEGVARPMFYGFLASWA